MDQTQAQLDRPLILRLSLEKRSSRAWPMNFGNQIMDDVLDRITDKEMFFGEGLKMFIYNFYARREMEILGARITDVHEIYNRVQTLLAQDLNVSFSGDLKEIFNTKGTRHASECILDVMLQLYGSRQAIDVDTKNYMGECLCIALRFEEYKLNNIKRAFSSKGSIDEESKGKFKSQLQLMISRSTRPGVNLGVLDENTKPEYYWIVYDLFREKLGGSILNQQIAWPDVEQADSNNESMLALKLFEDEALKMVPDMTSSKKHELRVLLDLAKRAIPFGWCIDYEMNVASFNTKYIQSTVRSVEENIFDLWKRYETKIEHVMPRAEKQLNTFQKAIIKTSLHNIGEELVNYFNTRRVVKAVAPYIFTIILKNELYKLSDRFGAKTSSTLIKHIIHGSTPVLYTLALGVERQILKMSLFKEKK